MSSTYGNDALCITASRRRAMLASLRRPPHILMTRGRTVSIRPVPAESIGSQIRVPGCVLDIAVPDILLDRTGVVPFEHTKKGPVEPGLFTP